MARQIVEQVDGIASDERIAGEQSKIRIEAGRAYMVVPRSDMHVTAQPRRLFTNHQREFRMSLETLDAEGNVGAGTLQLRGPMQVSFLVKARLDLDGAGQIGRAS